jgi:hypothetical protein
MGDDLDAMNARMVREQGLREFREHGAAIPVPSVVREKVGLGTTTTPPSTVRGREERTNGAGKLRKRSVSRGLRESAPNGLERVPEQGEFAPGVY